MLNPEYDNLLANTFAADDLAHYVTRSSTVMALSM